MKPVQEIDKFYGNFLALIVGMCAVITYPIWRPLVWAVKKGRR